MASSVQPVDVAATITALGGIAALLVGARATKPKRDGEIPLPTDPADRPAALRERIAALETDVRRLIGEVDSHDERLVLLEALRASLEALEHERDRSRRQTRTQR